MAIPIIAAKTTPRDGQQKLGVVRIRASRNSLLMRRVATTFTPSPGYELWRRLHLRGTAHAVATILHGPPESIADCSGNKSRDGSIASS
jgi:hypothetical protein